MSSYDVDGGGGGGGGGGSVSSSWTSFGGAGVTGRGADGNGGGGAVTTGEIGSNEFMLREDTLEGLNDGGVKTELFGVSKEPLRL